jgi:APA family basic amino acid/polyamine antiporter
LSESKVFVRDATGLVKSFSAFDAFVLNLIGLSVLPFLASTLLVVPASYSGANFALALLLCLPLIVTFAYNYGVLGATMPRTGGDYVFGSRIVHPVWGLLSSTYIGIGQAIFLGLLPAILISVFFPTVLPSNITSTLSHQSYTLGLGTLMIGLFLLPAVLGSRVFNAVEKILVGFGFLGLFAFIGTMAVYSSNQFETAFTKYAQPYNTSFIGVMNLASKNGWSPPSLSIGATVAAAVFSLFFLLTAWPVYFGGEIKGGSGKSIPYAIIFSNLVNWALAMIGILLFFKVVPYNFSSALGFLSTTSAYPLPKPPTIDYLVGIVSGNWALAFFIALAVILWYLAYFPAYSFVNSRIFFSWAFDRIIPQRFASVDDRTGTPIFSLFVVGLIAWFSLILATYVSIYAALLNFGVIVVLNYLPTGYTAALLPFRRKDIFRAAPSFVRSKVGPVPVVTITGLIHGIGFTGLLVALLFFYPQVGGPVTPESMGVVLLIGVFAVALYFVAKYYRKARNGIDISLAYKEIPPE